MIQKNNYKEHQMFAYRKKSVLSFALSVCVCFLFGSGSRCTAQEKSKTNEKPNFIIWVADDQYLESVGCYGANPSYTPSIDKLASEGMRFTRAYSTTSICTPARAALYTGMYPIKNGAHPNHSGLKKDIPTMPGIMRNYGYRSALVGKEGVHKAPTRPTNTFDWDAEFPHTKKPIPGAEYSEDASKKHRVMDYEAIKQFMESDDSRPYCLFVASSLPHGPGLSEIENGLKDYPANNWTTDKQFEWYMNILDKSGKRENTVIIYVSDNGSNTPRSKYTLYEPGVHIPMIVSWPGKTEPNSICDALVDFADVMPTLMAINGKDPLKEMDGKNMLPLLDGKKTDIHDDIFLSFTALGVTGVYEPYPIRGVVTKQYKLLHYLNHEIDPPKGSEVEKADEYQLFDLLNDPQEEKNLFDDPQFQDIQKDMLGRLAKWQDKVGDKGLETEYEAVEMFPEIKDKVKRLETHQVK
jgi:N-sulfoglucosamine sulfohydrolase